jgi:isoleucyl-tRNA synthetase
LKERGILLKAKLYKHDYPFCWRCDTPLLYYAKDSWFIKVTGVKDDLLKNAAAINWVPDYIKAGRFGEWLENIKDWAISRERYWGTPLPIWECDKCKQFEVIGSYEELEKKTGALPKNQTGELDVHRPYVDDLNYSCECGGKMNRLKGVFDCWFDSGAMPFAEYHYPFENKDLIDRGGQYPAEYISEAIDQTRGWFYTLLAVATLLDRGAPYKNCICLGHIRDKQGKKMSKSKGNIVDLCIFFSKVFRFTWLV